MRNMQAMIDQAEKLQEARLINFGAVGLASGGGAFKADEYFKSAKRFKKVWLKGTAAKICASTVLQNATLTMTLGQDRWASVGAVLIEIYNETAVVINGKVMGQISRLAELEIADPNGKSVVAGSLRGHSFGCEQIQGEADEIEATAAAWQPARDILIDAENDFITPQAFLNPGEILSTKITGLQGTTAADSFTGDVYAILHVLAYCAIKG